MSWFNSKKKAAYNTRLDVEAQSRVEVVAHQKATKEQINSTKKVNQELNKLLTENGFTLKIYLATNPNAHHKGGSK